jgi:hypothetical protein
MLWVVDEGGRGALFDDFAVLHKYHAIRHLASESHLVRRRDHGHPRFGRMPNHGQHLRHRLGI